MSYRKSNKFIGDDTKAAVRQSPNCIKNQKYGETRFSIWRMQFLHLAMWQVALGRHAIEFTQTSAISKFYIWLRFRPHHRSRHVILHQSLEILSKSDQHRQKEMTSCRFSRWRISAVLDFRGPKIFHRLYFVAWLYPNGRRGHLNLYPLGRKVDFCVLGKTKVKRITGISHLAKNHILCKRSPPTFGPNFGGFYFGTRILGPNNVDFCPSANEYTL